MQLYICSSVNKGLRNTMCVQRECVCVCVCVCVLTEQNSIDLWPEQKTNVYTENCILCSVIKQKGNKWNAFHTCFCITNMLIPGWFTEAGCDPNNLLILSTDGVWHIVNAWIIKVIVFGLLAHKICCVETQAWFWFFFFFFSSSP